jgi:hypothetical protein
MARPPKADREAVKSNVVGVKLTQTERDMLDRLVNKRAADVEKLTGQRLEMNASAYIRWLIAREAKAEGVDEDMQHIVPGTVAGPLLSREVIEEAKSKALASMQTASTPKPEAPPQTPAEAPSPPPDAGSPPTAETPASPPAPVAPPPAKTEDELYAEAMRRLTHRLTNARTEGPVFQDAIAAIERIARAHGKGPDGNALPAAAVEAWFAERFDAFGKAENAAGRYGRSFEAFERWLRAPSEA